MVIYSLRLSEDVYYYIQGVQKNETRKTTLELLAVILERIRIILMIIEFY